MGSDSNWGLPHIPYDDWEEAYKPAAKWKYCMHKWIDTGMRRTYCKWCDVRGDRDVWTGDVTVIAPAEVNDNIKKGEE